MKTKRIHVKGQHCAGLNCDCGYKTEQTHTAGPWRTNGDGYILSGNGKTIAEVRTDTDASLIASAPELLEACENALQVFRAMGKEHLHIYLTQAIAKARGEV